MLNQKKIQAGVAVILAGWILGCGRQAVPQGYLDDTANDVYQAVLDFEDASRNAFEPCFRDMEKDEYEPAEALAVCQEALQSLESIGIAEELPPKIFDLLSEAKNVLLVRVEYNIEVGKYNIGERTAMPFSMDREQLKVSDILNKAKKIAQPL